jgi:hypothetical protein
LEGGDQAGLLGVGRPKLGDDRGLDGDGRRWIDAGNVGESDRGLRMTSGQARLPMGLAAQLHRQSSHRQTRKLAAATEGSGS